VSTCIGVWASRSFGCCCRHGGPYFWLAYLGYPEPWQLLLGQGNQALDTGILGSAFLVWAPGGYCSSAASMGGTSFWVLGVLGPDFPHELWGVQSSGSAARLAQENQACKQWEFWSLISCKGFRECSSMVLLPGEPSLLACAFCYPWSPGSCLHRGTGFPAVSGWM
jgi:hypothetical protein